jgi:hypothetical protein
MLRRPRYHTVSLQPYSRFTHIAIILCIFVLSVVGLYYFFGSRLLPNGRYSFVLLGDPVEVVSIDRERNDVVTIRFPKDTVVSGVSGLGDYRLDALWSVAATDASPAAVVLESLTDEVGVSIDRYIAQKGDIWKVRKVDGPVYPSVLSPFSLIPYLRHGFESNISFFEFVGLTRTLMDIDLSKINEYDLAQKYGLSRQTSADNLDTVLFDRDSFDRMTENVFQDTDIRQEGLRVAVLNTTGKELLGTRVARIVSKLGAHVIQVGNDVNLAVSCDLVGTKASLQSKTAQTIRLVFGCISHVTDQTEQADLTIRVGKGYAEKYAPKR